MINLQNLLAFVPFDVLAKKASRLLGAPYMALLAVSGAANESTGQPDKNHDTRRKEATSSVSQSLFHVTPFSPKSKLFECKIFDALVICFALSWTACVYANPSNCKYSQLNGYYFTRFAFALIYCC